MNKIRPKQKYRNLVPAEEVFDKLNFNKQELGEVEQEAKYLMALMDIREMRMRNGLTQRELAEKSGVPRETISRIESGNRNTTIDKLQRIAKAMNMVVEVNFVPYNELRKS